MKRKGTYVEPSVKVINVSIRSSILVGSDPNQIDDPNIGGPGFTPWE